MWDDSLAVLYPSDWPRISVTQAEQHLRNFFRAVHHYLSGSLPYQHFGARFTLPPSSLPLQGTVSQR